MLKANADDCESWHFSPFDLIQVFPQEHMSRVLINCIEAIPFPQRAYITTPVMATCEHSMRRHITYVAPQIHVI